MTESIPESLNNFLIIPDAEILQPHPSTHTQTPPCNRSSSYSRQNLLSTKNIEMLHNLPLDRSNLTNPFAPPPPPPPKSNSDQASENATPRRRAGAAALPQPPDVLNVNHNLASVDHNLANVDHNLANVDHNIAGVDHNIVNVDHNIVNVDHNLVDAVEDLNLNARMLDVGLTTGVPMMLNSTGAFNDVASNHSNVSEEREASSEQVRRRNEWRNEGGEEQTSKSKLFEELRENVYREVASLISANETRPHFLIQLFRDLQMIGSDSLRLKILQSIQAVVSHSMLSSQNSNRLSLDSQVTSTDQDISQISDNFSVQSGAIWCRSIKSLQPSRGNDSFDYPSMLKGVMAFLNERESEVVQSQLLSTLKKTLLESGAFKEAVTDTVFQKHFSNILDEVLEQYCGKKVKDIRTHLSQTLNELLCGEIGFIQFIQETDPENLLPHIVYDNPSFPQDSRFEQLKNSSNAGQPQVENNMQNGDLAEADQTRMIEEDVEEEGAVGGILVQPYQPESHEILQGSCEELELNCSTEGLDQVPTRLLTKSKSRSTTPSRDRSNSRADPDSF